MNLKSTSALFKQNKHYSVRNSNRRYIITLQQHQRQDFKTPGHHESSQILSYCRCCVSANRHISYSVHCSVETTQ